MIKKIFPKTNLIGGKFKHREAAENIKTLLICRFNTFFITELIGSVGSDVKTVKMINKILSNHFGRFHLTCRDYELMFSRTPS